MTPFELITTGVNFSILIVIVKMVRTFTRIELKVEMMWAVFSRKFGTREGEDGHDE